MVSKSKTSEYLLSLDDAECPCSCKHCPVVDELNEKLREISKRFNELERAKRRKQFPQDSKKVLGAKDIYQIRVRYRLTQEELAYLVGVNVASVNRWQKGSVPSAPLLEKLHEVRKLGIRKIKMLIAHRNSDELSEHASV